MVSVCWGLFVEFEFECGDCSLAVDVNTNPGYLNVENMLPTPSVVEITNSNSHKNRNGNATGEVRQMLLRGIS